MIALAQAILHEMACIRNPQLAAVPPTELWAFALPRHRAAAFALLAKTLKESHHG